MRVVSIDPGIANLSFCVLDGEKVLDWQNVRVGYMDDTLDFLSMSLVQLARKLADYGPDLVVLENQVPFATSTMQNVFCVLLGALRGMGKTVLIAHPVSVKKHFSLPLKGWEANKRNAVDVAIGLLEKMDPTGALLGEFRARKTMTEKHNLADSLLLALFGLSKFSPPPPKEEEDV